MNDINSVSTIFDLILYADDTTLSCTLEGLSSDKNKDFDPYDKINNELQKIYTWLSTNKLSLNVSKSKFMIFHLPRKDMSSLGSPNLAINGISLSRTNEFDFWEQ